MQVSDKAPGLESQDVDYDVLQEAQAGAGAGTARDDDDMHRMGKIQDSNSQGLTNGGMAGLFWSFIWTFIGFGFIIASLSEMASMAPTSGGQYHWVSEFSAPRYQKFLSYITGWMSVLAWQAGSASGSFLTGTIIQGLISIRDPNYIPENWQGTLFVFAMILVIYIFNVHASNLMPVLNNLLMILHILSWAVVVIALWALAPHQHAKAVFTQWENLGGWSSMGLSVMIGQISAIYASLSSDATAHMSEEVKDAGRSVPVAIAWGYFSNGLMAVVVLIAYLFSMPSVDDALNDATGFPFLYVFENAVSTAGVNGLTAIILLPVIFSNILFNASTSRQTFAFARDKGLPFSKWISKVDEKRKIPVNAIVLSCIISCLLSLINIGSQTAFNAIISLNVAALMYTYIISISCVIYRKIWHADTLPPCRWDMGRWGLPVNIVGLVYCCFSFFWSLWPSSLPVTLDTFNWSVVIFGGVFMTSLGMYVFKGRKQYAGPAVILLRLQD
ncbi:GABA permease, putative [Talaromyces stipitatus ATCC 10500]|uniref:GABA permease, putative n=1 Tax=Talaromyces stipitatus (strain ATCC 10500 / CBS 375.48 / QM 6759 / NRRL 1006) TaxID=441959 RepID=B8M941_TALSN|nr:GABA permease, putative [Talaromyces stipitatus ATCC 10500]EED17336.1 GABA permease, putative [Talaromyces stipitatus ATCC 10500]